jgi:hypothetical protein
MTAEAASQRGTANTGAAGARTPVGTFLGSATLWAVINANGTVARSDGANVGQTGLIAGFAGSYEVIFRRDVTGCAYVATIGNAGAGNPAHGSIVVAARAGKPFGVFVETRDSPTGPLANHPFHLFVNC